MTSTEMGPLRSPEATDLERRVLAHERILQSLIAYMSLAEPRFIDHLKVRFVEPMAMARHEHDHRDVDDYAEEFVRAVMRIGEVRAPKGNDELSGSKSPGVPDEERTSAIVFPPVARPDRVQLKEAGGIWKLSVDGVFEGDYRQKEHALAAAALANLSLH